MPIELTEQQKQAIDALTEAPPRVVDPRTSATYVLIPASDYEALREAMEDERQQSLIRTIGLRNAARRMDELP